MSDKSNNDDDFNSSGQIPFDRPIAEQKAAQPSPSQAPVTGSAPGASGPEASASTAQPHIFAQPHAFAQPHTFAQPYAGTPQSVPQQPAVPQSFPAQPSAQAPLQPPLQPPAQQGFDQFQPWQQQPASEHPFGNQPNTPWQQPSVPPQTAPQSGPFQPAPSQPQPWQQSGQQSGQSALTGQGQHNPPFTGQPAPWQNTGTPNQSYRPDGSTGPVPPASGMPAYPPQPGFPAQAGAPKAHKKLSKKALTGIIIGAVAAVVAVILIIVYVAMPTKPNADDYLDAHQQTGDMYTKYGRVSSSLTEALYAASSGSKFTKEDADKVKEKVKAFDDSNAKFSEFKAYQDDDDVKQAFDKYNAKAKNLSTLANNLADTAIPLSAASKACDSAPNTSMYDDTFYSSYETYISGCTKALDDLSSSKVKGIPEYAKTIKDYMTSVGDIIKQMKELGNPDDIQYGSAQYAQMDALVNQYYDIQFPYDASTKLGDALRDLEDSSNPSNELDDLTSLLQDKITEQRK